MNRAECQTCTDPVQLLRFMRDRTSPRKHRLFLLAANRLVLHEKPDNEGFYRTLDRLEDAADGSIETFPIPESFPPFGVEVVEEVGKASWLANLLFEDYKT